MSIFSLFKKKPKVIVILGQTATGKTSLSIELAKKFNGEIISADSRQVYRGMDIGTAKVTVKEMEGIPHYMIDVADPDTRYTVQNYVETSKEIIVDIIKRKKVPIICGGTGMYIDALIHDQTFPPVPPNPRLRKGLDLLSTEELFNKLEKRDPVQAKRIDRYNKVRIMRALEIIDAIGSIPRVSTSSPYQTLFIGLELPKEELHRRIHKRIINRFNEGMLEEAKELVAQGISHERLEELGLEYRYMSRYLRNKISYQDMLLGLETETKKFAKRQKTWFKRNKDIKWFNPQTDSKKIIATIEKFLK